LPAPCAVLVSAFPRGGWDPPTSAAANSLLKLCRLDPHWPFVSATRPAFVATPLARVLRRLRIAQLDALSDPRLDLLLDPADGPLTERHTRRKRPEFLGFVNLGRGEAGFRTDHRQTQKDLGHQIGLSIFRVAVSKVNERPR